MIHFESDVNSADEKLEVSQKHPLRGDLSYNSVKNNSQISINSQANFTKDSSLSSTSSDLFQDNIITNSHSKVDSLMSLGKDYPSFIKPEETRVRQETPSLKAEYKTDIPQSQASNCSVKEGVAKLLHSSTPNYDSVVKSVIPEIISNPDVIRLHLENRSRDKSSYSNDFRKLYSSIQLVCDEKKLIHSDVIDQWNKNVISEANLDPNLLPIFVRGYKSIDVQTIPVLVYPLLEENHRNVALGDGNQKEGADTLKSSNKKFKSSEVSTQKSLDSMIAKQTSERETQAPPLLATRTRTHSDFTTCSKEITDKMLESSPKTGNCDTDVKISSEVVWGDVYNDYKKVQVDHSEKTPTFKSEDPKVKRSFQAKSPKFGIRTSRTAGDINRRTAGSPVEIKDNNLLTVESVANSLSHKYIAGRKINSIVLKLPSNPTEIPNNMHFQKFYELQPHDEMVKSYLTPTDRRIRAVCSKIGCKIGMYGPIGRYHTEGSRQAQSMSRVKTFYYINVFADTKERLDKAIKCIQETFPKACLNERPNNQFNLENCGNEIPI